MALTRPRYSQIPDTDWKQSVRVATTEDVGNVMLAAMPNTVDGVTLSFYDRVLVRSQANAAQNGIYQVIAVGTGSNGIWERTKDASTGGVNGAVTPSIVTMVEEGTVNKNRTFKLTTTGNIALGTTDLSFGVQAAEASGSTGQLQFANVNNVIGGASTTNYDYTTGNLSVIGGNLVTTNLHVTTTSLFQNGKRVPQVFTSATPPGDPAAGDQWYQIGTDILYEWIDDGSTSYWVDVSGATIANVNPITGETVGTLVINGGQDSTSVDTGALQVVGGVGITGNLFVGGTINLPGGGSLGTELLIGSNATATSETTGALVIPSPGGIGIGGNIWAGGVIVANSRIPSTSTTTGAIVLPGIGGIGIGGNIWAGGDITAIGTVTGGSIRKTTSANPPVNPVVGDQWYQTNTDILYQYVNDGTSSYWVDVTGATVANISAYNQQSLNDIAIVSGTPSTDETTGALVVAGGVGITGNLNLVGNLEVSGGNIIANQNVTSTNTTTGSMVVTGQGGIGVGGNVNIGGNLSVAQSASFAQNVDIAANLIVSGTYFSAAGFASNNGDVYTPGFTVINGNLTTTGTTATVGGLTITNGTFGSLPTLGVIGAATIGGDLAVTGNITGGGLRKYAQVSAPTNPIVGDVWYKTDTDVYYTYVNDGTSKYWIDYTSATVSNANPTSPQSLQDLQIVSGTVATNTTSGALQVQGGAGITGNLYAANVSVVNVSADIFTYANGVSILAGNEGTYSNANVTAYLTARSITLADGNITAPGGYLSAGGFTAISGNISATSANIGGVIIENGGIGQLASLGVIGAATIGGDLAVTGNITGGGLRKTQSTTPPANPVVGDLWYKTDTDVMYQYINDGTSKFWVDYVSATVSNANPTSPQSLQDLQIVSGTESTSTSTGALVVQGGAGISGNVFTGNLSTATISASNFTFANGISILAGNEGTYSNANVTAYLTARTTTISDGYLASAGMTVTAGNLKTTSANIGGLVIENGGLAALASLGVIGSATIGGDLAVTGNITGGGVNKYAQTSAPANPVPGDIWYKTDTDVYYTFVNDGTSKYWIDYVGATVSNAAVNNSTSTDILFSSGTASTDYNTGAVRVIGGVGVDGDINASGDFAIGGTFTADAGATVGYLNVTDGIDSYGNVIVHGPGTENYTVQVRSSDAADDVLGVKTSVGGGGFAIDAMNSELTGATPLGINANTFSIGIKNSVGTTVQADALKVNTAGNVSVAKTLSIGQHLAVTGNVSGSAGTFTTVFADTANLTTLNLSGALTVSTLNVTTSIDAPGIRKYAQISAPTSPAAGDVWYKTDTDVYYTYVNDGTNSYWIDYVSATVSNAAVDNSTNNDLRIASGTESTDTDTGALTVVGGVGVVGNIFAGGIVSAQGQLRAISGVQSSSTTTGALVVTGGVGVSANLNVGGALATDSFQVAGVTNLSGNLYGTNMSLSGRADIIGAATIGGNLDISGRVTGGGIRKTTSISAPSSPVVGDLWYKTDTDVLYQYVNDGTSNYWIDYVGPTVSNASPSTGLLSDLEIVTGTSSTSTTTGAARITGGVGITENLNVGGITKLEGNLVAGSGTASTNTTTGAIVVDGGIGISGATWIGTTLNVVGSAVLGTTLNVGGDIGALANISVAGRANITGDLGVTGNITGGGVRKTASTTAPANPVPGDVWYKTDTDVYYTYINDGSSNFWVDYVGATVSNAAVDNSTNVDFTISSGTPSVDSSTGALRVAGGFGITGDIYADGVVSASGNIVANATTASTNTTTGALVVKGGVGIAGAVYTGGLLSVASNIAGANLSTGQINASGNLYLGGSTSIMGRADIIGAATIGGNLDVTGAITGGGIRKTSSTTAPVNPVVGDVWYKTDTDVYYTYVNDGTSNYWIDYVGATVSNAAVDNSTNNDFSIASGTDSTSTGTGALTVVGGVGVTGNLYLGGLLDVAGNISGDNLTTGKITATDITVANVNAAYATLSGALQTTLGAAIGGNLTAAGTYFSAGGLSVTAGDITTADFSVVNGNITATGTTATIGGLTITDGGIGSLASLSVIGDAGIGGNLTVTGTVTGGGIRKTTSVTAPVNPVVGDLWYKQDTDVMYQYVNDGTSTYWVDFVGATVANAVANSEQLNYDLVIVTNTPSTDPSTGAIRVSGGVGVIGDVNISSNVTVGNVIANKVYSTGVLASSFTYPNGSSILDGYYFGTYSNANVANYLTSQGVSTAGGNLTSSGTYFSAGGLTAFGGNLVATGARAEIGGLVIENGAFSDIASLGVIGSATIGGDLAVTGNVTGGGIRKTTSTTAPINPIVGDLWYKSDTDTLYQYLNDGASTYWIDIVGAAVSNRAVERSTNEDFTIASGTASTDIYTGALKVVGGAGVTGNVYVGNNIVAGDNLTVVGTVTAGNTSVNTLTASGAITGLSINAGGFTAALNGLSIAGVFAVTSGGNLTATGDYFSAGGLTSLSGDITGNDFSIVNGNITASGTTATIAGLTIDNGSFGSVASLDVVGDTTFGANVDITGTVTGGGIRKTTSISAPVNPVVGDQWYKTDTDILYEYIFDGTSRYWVDLTSASVANVTASYDNLGDLTVVGNVSVTGSFNFANGTPYITTTLANTTNIVANLSNGFNVGLDLTTTGAVAGNYGSATSIPTLVVDQYGRISSITSNAVSTTVGLQGNIGTGSVTGGSTLIVQGVSNQIETTVSGSTITIGFTPNITFTDFTVSGNLVYGDNGLRSTTSATPPSNPTNGDMWYQTGTDILYRYVNDGTSEYWLDLFSTPLRAVLPEQDIGGGDGEVQYNDNGAFGANANFSYDQVTQVLKVPRMRVTQSQSPATPTSTGLVGEITWDGNWVYVCVAPNTWRRAGLYSW